MTHRGKMSIDLPTEQSSTPDLRHILNKRLTNTKQSSTPDLRQRLTNRQGNSEQGFQIVRSTRRELVSYDDLSYLSEPQETNTHQTLQLKTVDEHSDQRSKNFQRKRLQRSSLKIGQKKENGHAKDIRTVDIKPLSESSSKKASSRHVPSKRAKLSNGRDNTVHYNDLDEPRDINSDELYPYCLSDEMAKTVRETVVSSDSNAAYRRHRGRSRSHTTSRSDRRNTWTESPTREYQHVEIPRRSPTHTSRRDKRNHSFNSNRRKRIDYEKTSHSRSPSHTPRSDRRNTWTESPTREYQHVEIPRRSPTHTIMREYTPQEMTFHSRYPSHTTTRSDHRNTWTESPTRENQHKDKPRRSPTHTIMRDYTPQEMTFHSRYPSHTTSRSDHRNTWTESPTRENQHKYKPRRSPTHTIMREYTYQETTPYSRSRSHTTSRSDHRNTWTESPTRENQHKDKPRRSPTHTIMREYTPQEMTFHSRYPSHTTSRSDHRNTWTESPTRENQHKYKPRRSPTHTTMRNYTPQETISHSRYPFPSHNLSSPTDVEVTQWDKESNPCRYKISERVIFSERYFSSQNEHASSGTDKEYCGDNLNVEYPVHSRNETSRKRDHNNYLNNSPERDQGPSNPKSKRYFQESSSRNNTEYKYTRHGDRIIDELYNSEHLEPEKICFFFVNALSKISDFMSSNRPIKMKLFLKVVSKGVSTSLASHRGKIIYSLRQQNLFERQDLQDELKSLATKVNLDLPEVEFIADLINLMKLMVQLTGLPKQDTIICNAMLKLILNKLGESSLPLKEKLAEVEEIQHTMQQTKDGSGCDINITRFICESDMYILPDIHTVRNNNEDFAKPHKIGTPYDSELHYLLYMFSLLREDFIRPLCNGIRRCIRYLDEESNDFFKDTDVRLFQDVYLQSTKCIKGTGIVWEIQLPKLHYHPSMLKFGSLLCFSHDNLSTLLYATVANRDAKSLKQGIIDVQFINNYTKTISELADNTFIMLESRSFYPAYFHTLNTLKDMYNKIENQNAHLPLRQFLIGHSVETRRPKYTEMNDQVSFNCLLQYGSSCTSKTIDSSRTICITDLKQWPTADELGLDQSQYDALQLGLTKEIALIQGPPGTGKTLIGLRLAEFLLENRHTWRTSETNLNRPLLLVSYTNHALDQFLGELIKKQALMWAPTSSIVRVGSRCENDELQKYNLKTHRRNTQRFHMYRREQDSLIKKFDFNNRMIKQYKEGLVHETFLMKMKAMSSDHYAQLISQHYSASGTRLLFWLDLNAQLTHQNRELDVVECDEDMWTEQDISEEDAERILENNDDSDSEIEDGECSVDDCLPTMALDMQTLAHAQYWQDESSDKKLKLFGAICANANKNERMSRSEVDAVVGIWQLNIDQRWNLYRYWIWEATSKYRADAAEAESEFEEMCQLSNEARATLDIEIMRKARLVAMTTTGAAQYTSALQIVAPAVVIIEEAAQVTEQHVLGALSKSCQHLIMIGDHQQLRPSYNDFQLCKRFNTDVSLFERWIKSGMEYKQLQLQHRMRPEISSLLKPDIYEHLDDHDSVFQYTNIRGMSKNMFFLDHDQLEDHSEGSLSHRNKHEAIMITKLYRHLRRQYYSPEDITILTTYKDQVNLLKSLIQKMEDNDPVIMASPFSKDGMKVRITAVDNYQGEENRIILLSLVRSNMDKNIGFLSKTNRICVALSRAREGLYVIGNLSLMREKSSTWEKILASEEEKQNIGKALELKCQNHKVPICVTNPEDFDLSPDGGCNRPCDTRLPCGHACSQKCHSDVNSHKLPCTKPCTKTCHRGHPCPKKCHEICKCKEKVMVELPRCGHTQEMFCSENPDEQQCEERCTLLLECGHVCQRKCGQRCNTPSNCFEWVRIDAKCGHNIQIACCTQANPHCTVPCTAILNCGHQCKGTCGKCFRGNIHQECKETCNRVLICGHTCKDKCKLPCRPCPISCERICNHSKCSDRCGDICVPCIEPCTWLCWRGCPNQYKCTRTCDESCDRPRCDHPCKRRLECGHRCAGFYCETCFCLECQKDDPTEIFFGTEDEQDAIFYQLYDCEHIFESSGLDTYMETDGESEIGLKVCPKCKSPVINSKRYNNVIKAAQKDMDAVKKRSLLEKDILERKKRKIKVTFKNFPNRILQTAKTAHELEILETFLQNRDIFLKRIYIVMESVCKANKHLNTEKGTSLENQLKTLQLWVNKRESFSEQQAEECLMEILRMDLVCKMYMLQQKVCEKDNESFRDDQVKIEQELVHLEKNKLSKSKSEELELFIAETTKKYELVGISKDEKIMIVKAMGFSKQGHWYKCKNGHIYAIGDCGGAMETAQCPECNEVIGGESHRLADDNQVAGEMDGARYGAWSEQANMQNYDLD